MARRGRPHKHPSGTCYKRHGCRCESCVDYYSLLLCRQALRQGSINLEKRLTESELRHLRRMVGVPADGPVYNIVIGEEADAICCSNVDEYGEALELESQSGL